MDGALGHLAAALGHAAAYPLLDLGRTRVTPAGLLTLLALLALVVAAERRVRRHVVARVLRRTRMDPALQYTIGQIAGYAFVALGGYVALQVVGIDLTSLAVIAGAVGVGVGFGLQHVVSNFVSGVIILTERSIAVGDRIEVAGVAGQVVKLSLRSTTVVTNDNITIVPNASLVTTSVTNWSHGDPKVRFRIPVTVADGADLEHVRSLLLAVAAAHPKALKQPAPTVFCTGLGESGPCGGADSHRPSGSAFVHVVEAAQHGPRADWPLCSDCTGSGGLQVERSVGPIAVVVADELRQHRAEMPLADHDEVIETLPSKRADNSLRDRVRPRGTHGREQGLDAQRRGALHEVATVDGVPIPKEVAGPPAPRRGLDHLAPDPRGYRVRRHSDVHQLAAPVRDQDEDVERLERQRPHGAQVGRPELPAVVGEERAPRLTRRAGGAAPPVPLDRALAHDDPELEQLPADALAAPTRVVPGHGGDQFADLGGQVWATEAPGRPPAPEQLPALSMPADDGLRPHDEQVLTPITPEAPGERPEGAVERLQPRPLARGASQHGELLAQ